MKVFRVAILVFVLICVFIGSHAFIMNRLGKSLSEKNQQIERFASADDWENTRVLLEKVETEWRKHSIWTALTISTKDIEQLEISLAQAKAFAVLEAKPDFFGEFIMFSKLVEHIPHREGFHIEEIL